MVVEQTSSAIVYINDCEVGLCVLPTCVNDTSEQYKRNYSLLFQCDNYAVVYFLAMAMDDCTEIGEVIIKNTQVDRGLQTDDDSEPITEYKLKCDRQTL